MSDSLSSCPAPTVVRACVAAGAGAVPQGGNTSLAGGVVPSEDGNEVVLGLARLNRVRAVDPLDLTLDPPGLVNPGELLP